MYYLIRFDKCIHRSNHLPSQGVRRGLFEPSGVGSFRILIWVLVILKVAVLTPATRDEFCLLSFTRVESQSALFMSCAFHALCLQEFSMWVLDIRSLFC